MLGDNVHQFVSRAEQRDMVFAAIILPLATMIHAGKIDPESVTRDEFFAALGELGRKDQDSFEVHVTRVEEEMHLVTHCVTEGEEKSGVVLLFTLLESEVNSLLRIHLRVRGFSSNSITDALRGIDFEAKLDIMLPLLDVTLPERVRNAALQCKSIRNLVVHNKATPVLMADDGTKQSDEEVASSRARRFFVENPLARLQRDLQEFVDTAISGSVAVQWGAYLFEKYYEA